MSNPFETAWTVNFQPPLSMVFPRQEYWSALPFPSEDLPEPGIKLTSPALEGGFFTTEPPEKHYSNSYDYAVTAAKQVITDNSKFDHFDGLSLYADHIYSTPYHLYISCLFLQIANFRDTFLA